jgi:hypothetical protein
MDLWLSEKRKRIREPQEVHKHRIYNAPSDAPISQPKVEFPQMAHRILLVLPRDSLTHCAKAALETILDLLQKSIICRQGSKPPRKFKPSISLGLRQRTRASRVTPSLKALGIHWQANSVPPRNRHNASSLIGSGSYSAAGFFPGRS